MKGSIIHGTHRPQDLIPAFLDAIESIRPLTDEEKDILEMITNLPDEHYYWISEEGYNDLDALFDELELLAPDGFYFGAHPGNGSDFGFWELEE